MNDPPEHRYGLLTTVPDRTQFISDRRGPKNQLNTSQAYGAFVENEAAGLGSTARVATILIANRECPWKCVFCDLWVNTLNESVPLGSIPGQVRSALASLPPARWIKLYNAGSFFDRGAIPAEDIPAIVELLSPFERVIIESHPGLIREGVNSSVLSLRDCLRNASTENPISKFGPRVSDTSREPESRSSAESSSMQGRGAIDESCRGGASGKSSIRGSVARSPHPRLEIAMGLETVHPIALERMNKGMTLDDFARAAKILRNGDIDLRAFVLVQPPFTPPEEVVEWAIRSLDFARDQGARMVAFIPTRGGNGAMEALAATGDFVAPRLSTLEEVLDRALESAASRGGPLVVADLWDLERFSHCPTCFPARKARLDRMNLSQQFEPRISCDCGS